MAMPQQNLMQQNQMSPTLMGGAGSPGGIQAPQQGAPVQLGPPAGAPGGIQAPPQQVQTPQGNMPTPQGNMPPQNSLEQNALAGGNKQQISNFMGALNQVGAGSNNTFMNSQNPNMPAVQNLVNPNVIYDNNGGLNAPPPAPVPNQLPQVITPNMVSGAGGNNPAPPLQPNMLPPVVNQNMVQGPPVQQPLQLPQVIDQNMITSDENLKINIKPAHNLNQFLDSIHAHSYQYKNPELDGEGTFVSPMAQELEKTELGKQAVIETPRGKMVNYPRLGAVNLAAVSVVHREQQRLQSQFEQLRKQMFKKVK